MYKLSNLAAEDFGSIYEYTWRRFGPQQAEKYTTELDSLFTLLGKNHLMGRECAYLMEGIRRHEHGHHSIFYLHTNEGVFIVRILHQQMNPRLHLQ